MRSATASQFSIEKGAAGYWEWRARHVAGGFWEVVEMERDLDEEYRAAEKKKARIPGRGRNGVELACSREAKFYERLSREMQRVRRERGSEEWLERLWEIPEQHLRSRVSGIVAWDYLYDRCGPLADLDDLLDDHGFYEVPCVAVEEWLVRLGWTPLQAFLRVFKGDGSVMGNRVTREEIERHRFGVLSAVE